MMKLIFHYIISKGRLFLEWWASVWFDFGRIFNSGATAIPTFGIVVRLWEPMVGKRVVDFWHGFVECHPLTHPTRDWELQIDQL
jgi:hypothetical protein